MMHPLYPRRLIACTAGLVLTGATLLAAQSCVQPHCSSPSYAEAECRVIAENVHARLQSSAGAELRFQDPDVTTDDTWDARGLVEELDDGTIHARIAAPGRFALSLRAPEDATTDTALHVRLSNVDPAATVTLSGDDGETEIPGTDSTRRELDLVLAPGQVRWIRGDRACPSRYRLAVVGDIQTNPTQFERIADRLAEDARSSLAEGVPLVGLVIVGDLTEASRDDEFETIGEVLGRLPIPTALTPGNHDIYRPTRPHFNRKFGPGNHAANICGLRLALLDSGSGSVAPSVQARVPELIDRNGATFLVAGMHHPPYAGLTGAGWSREDDAAALLVELARERADLVVAGHSHALRDYEDIPVGDVTLREVIVGTGGAYQGIGIPRYGYMRFEFDDDAATTEQCFMEVPPVGYAEPPNEPASPRLPHCPEP
ncbi:MAG: metallophosphoesterase [Myxococcota bacterium]